MTSTILIVEDEPDMRFLLRLTLETGSLAVVEAESGELAVERMIEEEPDLVLLDLNLPGMSGLDVVDWMRETGLLDRVGVLMLTADTRAELGAAAAAKGCVRFLAKPVPPEELLASIRAELADRRSS
jgi:DNA-binding response OmpR family regulator